MSTDDDVVLSNLDKQMRYGISWKLSKQLFN